MQSARENGFVQNEAIACELAAGFYLARGFAPSGNAYLEQARTCYARWGADGKVRQLDERYPQLRARTARAPATPVDGETQLDMLSVTKASQAISGRIVLDEADRHADAHHARKRRRADRLPAAGPAMKS